MKKVIILIIGNEILSGEIKDTNGYYLMGQFREMGFEVLSSHILKDDIGYVSNLIRNIFNSCDFLFTVGGLGPTIDDITLDAVAKALNLKLEIKSFSTSLEYRNASGSETKNNTLKKHVVGSEIINTANGPIVNIKNIYCLPGLPSLVKSRFEYLKQIFKSSEIKQIRKEIYLDLPQSSLSLILEELKNKYSQVSIGCYPQSSNNRKTKVLFTSDSKLELENIIKDFSTALNK